MASRQFTKFGGHKHCGAAIVLGCHVISHNHVIEGSCNFMGRNLLRQVIALPSLVAIGNAVVKIY